MPYIIIKKGNTYKVCKKNQPSKCFSKKGLKKETALRQMRAIIYSESKQKNLNRKI